MAIIPFITSKPNIGGDFTIKIKYSTSYMYDYEEPDVNTLIRIEAFTIIDNLSNQRVQATVNKMHVTIFTDYDDDDDRAYAVYDNRAVTISNTEEYSNMYAQKSSGADIYEYYRMKDRIVAEYDISFTYNGKNYSYKGSDIPITVQDGNEFAPVYVEAGSLMIGDNILYPPVPWEEFWYKSLKISWSAGTLSGTIVNLTNAKYSDVAGLPISFNLPDTLIQNGAEYTTVRITVSAEFREYRDSGYSYSYRNKPKDYLCYIPRDSAPVITDIAISDLSNHLTKFGAYLQGESLIGITVSANGKYGASISSCRITCDDRIINGTSGSLKIKRSGLIPVNVTVVDSRGGIATGSTSVRITEYFRPSVNIIKVLRVDADGNGKSDGNYAKLEISDNVCPIYVNGVNKNTAGRYVKYRIRGSASWSNSYTISVGNSVMSINRQSVIVPASSSSVFEFSAVTSDLVTESESAYKTLSTALVLLDFDRENRSIGFGQMTDGSNSDRISVGLEMHMNGNRIHDIGRPAHDNDAVPYSMIKEMIGAIYPVGSIYISMNSANPSTFIGGTWQRIEDSFLLAAGSKHSAGTTGGAEEVTLTVEQMPSHRHVQRYDDLLWTDETTHDAGRAQGNTPEFHGKYNGYIQTTEYAGGGQAHNNMPPYLAVYMWKRIA